MKRQIAEFVLERPIGQGPASTVYLAHQNLPGEVAREVAIKLLPPIPTGDRRLHDRFINEAKALVSMSNHQNIVSVLTYGVEDGLPFIAMEYVEHTLSERIADEPAEPELVRSVLQQVVCGLRAMHEHAHPLLHRDIKPANVLLDEYGIFKITDFGLAAPLRSEQTFGIATVRYAAPEALNRDHGEIGPATDLYSLGHLAYELALGRKRYRAQFPAVYGDDHNDDSVSPAKWMAWHCSEQLHAPPLAACLDGFPPQLSEIIDKLMRKPLADRYAAARDVEHDLQELPGATKPAAPPPRATATAATAAKKSSDGGEGVNRNLLIAVAAMIVLLGIVMFWSFTRANPTLALDASSVRTQTASVSFSGRVEDFPDGGKLALVIGSTRRPLPDPDAASGAFTGTHTLGGLDTLEAEVQLTRDGEILASQPITLVREPPVQVSLRFTGLTSIAGETLTIGYGDAGENVTVSPDGTAAIDVPYGSFEVGLQHDRYSLAPANYETGIEAERTVGLALIDTYAKVDVRITPPDATLRLFEATTDENIPLDLNRRGSAVTWLPPGDYAYEAQRVDYRPGSGDLTVRRDGTNRLHVILRREQRESKPALPEIIVTPENLDAARVASMSTDELTEYVRSQLGLVQLRYAVGGPRQDRIIISGAVFNDDELVRIQQMLEPALARVDIGGIVVDRDSVRIALQRDLRDGGIPDADVRNQKHKNLETFYMRITGTATDEAGEAEVSALAHGYVIDRTLVVTAIYEG